MAGNNSVGIPQVLGGHYEIVRELAAGGFGHTFVARDLHLPGQPLCVVKQLKLAMSAPGAVAIAQRLFDQEAKVLYALGEHPQIPRLLAHFEENQPGQPTEFYLAQELIEAKPLSDRILIGQPWPEAQAIALLQDLLQILAFVHQKRVIHRDIKPDNLLWREADGRIVLIDFGAVKSVQQSTLQKLDKTAIKPTERSSLTVAIGTPGYMPSEQQSGKPRFSSDIYAAGKIAIQAVTGLPSWQLDHDDETGEIEWRSHAPHISDAFANLLSTMVRYDFRSRYPNGEKALEALRSLPISLPISPDTSLPASLPTSLPTQTLATVAPMAYTSTAPSPPATAAPPAAANLLLTQPFAAAMTPPAAVQAKSPVAQPSPPVEQLPPHWLARHRPKVVLGAALSAVLAVGATMAWTLVLSPFTDSLVSETRAVSDSQENADFSSGNRLEAADNPNAGWSNGGAVIEGPVVIMPPGSLAMSGGDDANTAPADIPQTAYDLAEQAEEKMLAGEYPQAIALYKQAEGLGLDTSEAQWSHCDRITQVQGQSNEGLEVCARVAGAEELDFVDVILAAAFLTGNAEYDRALKVLHQLEPVNPTHPTLQYHKANAFIGKEHYPEALELVEQGLKEDPDMADLWVMKGDVLLALNRPEEALVAGNQALTLSPQSENALNLTARATVSAEAAKAAP
ncbi:MAG: serine/threonine-protein kinase [Cyanobacteria bacterium J06607_10]